MAELLPTIVFYMFALTVIASAAMVIISKNPVHSVFFLILAFFNSAGLFVLLGAEYIAMTLVIVYVGAVFDLAIWVLLGLLFGLFAGVIFALSVLALKLGH